MTERHEFPTCMHWFAASLHIQQINPGDVEIVLPFDDWWKLYCLIERQFRGLLTPTFDGRQTGSQFKYMGFTFKARPAA